MTEVHVVDVGCGNTLSVLNMLRRIGVAARPQAHPASGDVLVLPGVGAWDAVAGRLRTTGWDEAVRNHAEAGRPVLGICLGMQLLGASSEEGDLPGLGLLPAVVRRLSSAAGQLVPRVGWRTVVAPDQPPSRFYFSHSFHLVPDKGHRSIVTMTTRHEPEEVVAAVANGAVAGAQFHPERSHRNGMEFLAAWAKTQSLRTFL